MGKFLKSIALFLCTTTVVWAAANRTLITNILRLEESGGSSAVLLQAPALSSDYSLTLPTSGGGSNEMLKSDGSGVLSWSLLTNSMVDPAAAIDYSKLNLTDAIINADIDSAAAIDYSKLDLANSIVDSDVAAAAAISYSKLDLADSIEDSDIATGAGIDASKLGGGSVSDTEFGYLDGVTSAIQTQVDAKLSKSGGVMTGALTLSGDADDPLEPVTKQQFDAGMNGISWKQSVRAATTAAGTLGTDFENGDTIDTVTVATGDRILIKNQATSAENGIYLVNPSGFPTRASDANDFSELNGAAVIVREGSANVDKGFQQLTDLSSFSGQSWVQNFGTGLYTADGQGIEVSGSTFALELNGPTLVKGGAGLSVNESALTLSNLGNILIVSKGGTGATSASDARTNLGAAASGANSDITSLSSLSVPLSIAQGGTGENTAANAINALVPSQSGNSGRFLKTNGALVSWADAGGGGGGSGGLSVITNGRATSDTSGWSDDANHTNTRLTSGSPADPTISTAFQFSASASTVESSTSGVYWPVSTMPSVLRSKKLKVEFYVTVPASDTWRLSVYDGTTRLALSTDASGATTLPAGFTGKYTTYVDTTTNASYSVNFTKTTHSGANHLVVTDVVFGDGTQPQGAVVEGPYTWTPTFTGLGTPTISEAKWSRVGTKMLGYLRVVSGTATGDAMTMTLPNSLTASITTTGIVGEGWRDNATASTRKRMVLRAASASNIISFSNDDYTWDVSPITNTQSGANLVGNTTVFTCNFIVEISEWAGSGTTNLAQNDVEYLANSDTGVTTNTLESNTVIGPDGVLIPSGTAGASFHKRVYFPTPQQNGDIIELQWAENSVPYSWSTIQSTEIGTGTSNFQYQGTTTYGIGIRAGAHTQNYVDVYFGQYQYASNASYGGAGSNWNGTLRWRVVKAKSGQAVGFGVADTTSSGLVPSGTYNRTSGAWTLGPSSGASQAHLIQGGDAVQGVRFNLLSNHATSGNTEFRMGRPSDHFFKIFTDGNGNGGGDVSLVAVKGTGSLNFYTGGEAAGNLNGAVSSTGAWTLGPTDSTFSATHTFNGRVASTGGSYSGVANATTFDLLSNTNIAASTCWLVHAWVTTASAGEYVTAFIHRPSSGLYFIRTLSSSGLSLGIGGSNQVQGTNNAGATRDIKWSAMRCG